MVHLVREAREEREEARLEVGDGDGHDEEHHELPVVVVDPPATNIRTYIRTIHPSVCL